MYQELENKALEEFEEKFVEDRGRYVEPIFKDAVGSVGPIKNFLKSYLKEAYKAGTQEKGVLVHTSNDNIKKQTIKQIEEWADNYQKSVSTNLENEVLFDLKKFINTL
jgi:hypothetical protein